MTLFLRRQRNLGQQAKRRAVDDFGLGEIDNHGFECRITGYGLNQIVQRRTQVQPDFPNKLQDVYSLLFCLQDFITSHFSHCH